VLDPIPTEDYEFTLKGIYYDLDKADIRSDAAKVLDSMSVILTNNPGITIELASHTDSRAPEDYNLKLSQKRAQSCVDYLVRKGIAKDRLTAVGYGETRLVNDCADGVDCTEEQHQENRRTTFRVLSTDYKKRR
jgi:outer membrane protein OmpA-like peptidoglycan-associated protein